MQDTDLRTLPSRDDAVNLGDLLNIIWLGRVWVITFTLIFTTIGVYYATRIATPKYISTSVVQLDLSGEQIINLGASLPNFGNESEVINTELEVLKSRKLAERVVLSENLLDDPEFNKSLEDSFTDRLKARILGAPEPIDDRVILASTINEFLKTVSVRNTPNTYVLRISVITEDAEKSMDLANRIADEYIQYTIDVEVEDTLGASEWLTTRVAELRIELEKAEARLAAFSSTTEVVSEASLQALGVQLKNLRERRSESMKVLEAAQGRLASLEAKQDASAEEKVSVANDPELTRIFNAGRPDPAFDARFTQLISQARSDVARQAERLAILTPGVQDIENQIESQSQELIQIEQLTRDSESTRLLYEFFLNRLKETSAQEGLQRARSRILSFAVLPTQPSEPNKPVIVGFALILGLAVGAGGAFLSGSRQNVYIIAEDLERDTGVPVFGQIPRFPSRGRSNLLDYLIDRPESVSAEAIRNLRTSLMYNASGQSPKVIMLTSALPGEGKTTMSFSLAHNFTGLGKKVLLVEGDSRRKIFRQYVDTKSAVGLEGVILGDVPLAEAITREERMKLDILSSGETHSNPADMYSSNRLDTFLQDARDTYETVIVDSPPVLIVPDARIIAQKVDMVILVVLWNKSTKRQVRDALHMFSTVGIRVDGLILNGIDNSGLKRYGYGEARYGEYGKKYYTN